MKGIQNKTICPICRKTFRIRKENRIYCSDECRKKKISNYHKKIYAEKYKQNRWKLRFEIFKRDNFTCQYCGRKAPNVELHIDHKVPQNKGGQNEKDNYITACKECNLGKGDVLL